jgi:hypothetical protein
MAEQIVEEKKFLRFVFVIRVYRWKTGVGKMNAITNRLQNSFNIKDNSLTGRNYERNNMKPARP